MSAASDAFTAFVRAVAEDLDEHRLRGEGYATRANLSRFHFDRLIRATAGEPPAAFRRRVLMERAAFRLVTTDASVLQIGLDAGYGSHEAFTRAFRRAYGVPPRRWRRAPRQVRLPAPNGVHFHPPGSLRLPASTEVTEMTLLVKMVEHHVWLIGQMVDRAARLPDDTLDRPIEMSIEGLDDGQTLRTVLSRLIGQMAMWNQVLASRDYDWSVERGESIASMRERLAVAGPAFIDEVRAVVADNRLDETFIDAHCEPPEVFTYGGLVAHVLTFAAVRRTVALGALASAGITDLGNGDPRNWVQPAA